MRRAAGYSLRALRSAALQQTPQACLTSAWPQSAHTLHAQRSAQGLRDLCSAGSSPTLWRLAPGCAAALSHGRHGHGCRSLHDTCGGAAPWGVPAPGAFEQPPPVAALGAVRGAHSKVAAEEASPVGLSVHAAGSEEREDEDSVRSAVDKGAMHAVHTAIACNVAILAAKMSVFAVSGSSSILAEGIHSLADIANQLLLRMGVASSRRAPDEMSNYGYRRELFVWSLISGVGIFCLGAGVTIVHGVYTLIEPPELEQVWASLAVLAVSLVIESYSLLVAWRALVAGAKARGQGLREYVKDAQDPTSMAIVAEDGAAVLGLAVAAVSLLLSEATGNAVYDAAGSVAVGSILGAVAGYLIQTNRRALVGRSLPRPHLEVVLDALRRDSVVSEVTDPKSEEVGPGAYRFKVEIEFNGDALVQRHLATGHNRDRLVAMFAAASRTGDGKAMDAALAEYGRSVVTAVGDEVDRLETLIRALEPSIKHVDIESN